MSKRELIKPNEGDKRYVRRDDNGQFQESDDRNAKKTAKPGQGDGHTGNRKPAK